MTNQPFSTMDAAQARQELIAVLERVARSKGRIEITGNGDQDACVIISKAELEALERALAILSDSDGVKEMAQCLARLASASHEQYSAS